jgi:CubicO group peptidase (beta-lactamase class C family)
MKESKTSYLLTILLFFGLNILLSGQTNEANRENINLGEVDRFIKEQVDSLQIPGISIAIIENKEIIYYQALGVKNIDTQEKVDTNTLFEACSMTKPIFAYAVLKLVEKNVLDLDTPLYKYYPNKDLLEDERHKLITARMILSHTSGLPNWRNGQLTINADPGTKQIYSGEGFEYLGSVIEHITGENLQDIIQKEVFSPLNIKNSYLVENEYLEKHMCIGHRDNAVQGRNICTEPHMSYSLCTDAKEYAKFVIAFMKESRTPNSIFNKMSVPQFKIDSTDNVCLGIFTEKTPSGLQYYQGGNNDNRFNSNCEFYIDRNIGYVYFINCNKGREFTENLDNYLGYYKKSSVSNVDSLTSKLTEIYKKGQINGLSVSIVTPKGVRYSNGFGYSDLSKKAKYTPNTIQNIGSVSKTLIGIALLKAQEMGKLNLDDSINKYLPFKVRNPFYSDIPITIRHLATHTSTITDSKYYNNKAYILKDNLNPDTSKLKNMGVTFNAPKERITLPNFFKKLLAENGAWYQKDNFLEKVPGAMFEYTNVGATLAAYILELATGESYDSFTTKHILESLEMSSSGWSFNSVDMNKHSILYANIEQSLPYYSLITYPDGGLITSVNDLSLYLIELIKGYSGNGILLTNKSYQEIFQEQLSSRNFTDRNNDYKFNDEYNSGIFMGITPVGQIGHSGTDPGIVCFMFFNPKTQIGKIVMMNNSFSSTVFEQSLTILDIMEKYENMIID